MKKPIFSLLAMVLVGCVGPSSSEDRTTLEEFAPGRAILTVEDTAWEGFMGPHGFIGSQRTVYYAWLEGPGPTYVNPRFQDNYGYDTRCTGTITLDQARTQVKIELQRMAMDGGRIIKTMPHPANGTHIISAPKSPMSESERKRLRELPNQPPEPTAPSGRGSS